MAQLIGARPHSFKLDAEHAALLVIDVQNDFCHPEGFCLGDLGLNGELARAVIEPIGRLVEWARPENSRDLDARSASKRPLRPVAF